MISILENKFAVLGFVMVAVLLIPVNDAEASHTRILNLIAPSDWISESGCESTPDFTSTYSTQCTEVVFPKNEILIFEKHHDPGEMEKAEIFIDQDDINGQTEIFSRWNLQGFNLGTFGTSDTPSDTTCVSGMTTHGPAPTASGYFDTNAYVLDGPTNSVCNDTIIVTRDTGCNGCAGDYTIKIDTSMLADGIHSITMNTYIGGVVYSATYDIWLDTTPTLTITNLAHYNCDSPAPPNQNQNWCDGTDHYRIDVDGVATGFAQYQPLTLNIISSNGTNVHQFNEFHASIDTGAAFGYEGPVFYEYVSDEWVYTPQFNDTFTVTICAPEFDVCDAESFTIDSIVEDTPADTSNFFFESLDITGDSDVFGPVIIVVVGESWHVTPTLAWEGTLPDSFPTGEPVIHGEIRYMEYANGTSAPSEQMGGTLYGSKNWSMISDGSVDYNTKTITLDTWSGLFDTNTNWPVGGYLVTITADTGNVLSETNESDNVIERLDIWSSCDHPPWDADVCVTDSPSADMTPPVVSVPNNLTFTGINYGSYAGIGKVLTSPEFASAGNVTAIDDIDGNIPVSCDGWSDSQFQYPWNGINWQEALYFLGTTTIT